MELYSVDGKSKCKIVGLSIDYWDRPMVARYKITAIDEKDKVRFTTMQRHLPDHEYFFQIGRYKYTLQKSQLLALLWARMEGDFNIQDKYK